jgi:tyrosyl-tRNA synthetase
MNFLEELRWREMLHDMTPETEEYLNQPMAIGYIGFDPTAPSLTIGNYVQIMVLTLFQKHGHKPIVLMGGATGRIGDPSFKESERMLKSYEELDTNLTFQMEQFKKLLNFEEGDNRAVFRNNLDFYQKMNVLDFMRDVGKNLTISYMMAKDSVKRRIETGLSFTEFSYQLIQGYDFQLLYQQDQCKLQMGGSDQWGNITSGTEIIRRNIGAKAYALTTPLLTKADGSKFGKSESGNIWLDPRLTSPYQFYQFWINADDRDVPKFLKYFSLRSTEEINQLLNDFLSNPNEVKRVLANELTTRIHSEASCESAQRVSKLLFQPKFSAAELDELSEDDWKTISDEIESVVTSSECPISLEFALTDSGVVFSSKSEYRRAVNSNAIAVNKHKISDNGHLLQKDDFFYGKYCLIENGKKNKYILKIN